MKSSLEKLKKLARHKNSDGKDKRDFQSSAHLDELAQASQGMQDMRNCYDCLLSAAAATTNSAYEFSESLREMGACLEKTALNDDEETGKALLMLGQVQYELQKLVDIYRTHIILTITTPSESLLSELRTVEDMKRRCDEKRMLYDYITTQQREKSKSKGGKGESFTLQQLQTVRDEYDEEATLCIFRLKSLKQGQSRSLLTQAARHHVAQLNLFRKGIKSLEAVDTYVKLVTEQQHIDYRFDGPEDDGEDTVENHFYADDDGELSFDYRKNKQGPDISTNLMETKLEKNQADTDFSSVEPRAGSQSAPLFAEKIFDAADKIRQIPPSFARKSYAYALPTPVDTKNSISSRTNNSASRTRPMDGSGRTPNLWHSSPLEGKKNNKDSGYDNLSGPFLPSVLKESNTNNASIRLPPPLTERTSSTQSDVLISSDSKKVKRQAFSGPITSKAQPSKPLLSSGDPIPPIDVHQLASGLISGVPLPQPSSSPKVSPSASPPLVSSPRISELHELPRPPISMYEKFSRSSGLVGFSAPLVSRVQETSVTNKTPAVRSTASPLPTPPQGVPRSYSIPSSKQKAMALHVTKLLESPQLQGSAEETASPPLSPISLATMNIVTTVPEVTAVVGHVRESFAYHDFSCLAAQSPEDAQKAVQAMNDAILGLNFCGYISFIN
ncbi:hypothetical protein RJ641_022536 [Dillenia turbinata]|uniref:BAR domain-containing protein n=1 Tax=Dillenia turbinata TaxID=194707 RepID=A0AAN8UCP2_9MAGN